MPGWMTPLLSFSPSPLNLDGSGSDQPLEATVIARNEEGLFRSSGTSINATDLPSLGTRPIKLNGKVCMQKG
jgi:hypothetical protein